jgi:WD40 repeat protein
MNFPAMAGSEVKKQQRHMVTTMPAKKEQHYYGKFDKNESNRRERFEGRRKQNHRQIHCPPHPSERHAGVVECLAVSADGKNLVSGDNTGVVRVWHAPSFRNIEKRRGLK